MSNSLSKFISTIPKVYHPDTNVVISSLLYAIAGPIDGGEVAVAAAKDQLFVRTATGQNLDVIGNTLGVQRPPTLGLPDLDYQALIPNLSLKPKQIRKAFYDTADVFWGPLFSRANITSLNFAPFNVSTGDVFTISIDGQTPKTLKVLPGEILTNGSASALEIQNIISKIETLTVSVLTDSLSGNESINIRTNTPGSTGKVQVLPSSMVSPSKLNLPLGVFNILNLDQRVVVYNIRPNELFIEIPAIVPALRRTLKGSHHFHQDATLSPPVAPNNGIWVGSFFYNPTGSVETVTITSQKCGLNQSVLKESVYTSIAVDNNSSFLNPSGDLFFGYGTSTQEGPVRYRGIPNSNTLLLDPSYVFKNDHGVGTTINVISQKIPYIPRVDGSDYAIYLTSPSGARAIVQTILESLAAAGVIVTFKILAPKYKYLLDNPYISTDDEPSIP